MAKIKLTKLKELSDAKYPNNIAVGYEKVGDFLEYPIIGERFNVGMGWSTSPVTEIIHFNVFKTYNSIYKIEDWV